MPDAIVNGVRLHYETHGAGGPPVLLLMGFTVAGKAWRFQRDALVERHRIVWFDNRGCGRSDVPETPFSMADMADDAIALLDHLGWEDAHVTGVSMGGMIAQEVALRHRDRVRSLALIATSPGGPTGALPTRRGARHMARVALTRGDRRLEAYRDLLFPPAYEPDPTWLFDVLREDYGAPPPPAGRRGQLRAILRHDTRDRLHLLEGLPTLVVRPGSDVLIRPEQSDRLHRAIPGARLLRLDDAGHGIIRQSRDALNAALLEHYQAAELAR